MDSRHANVITCFVKKFSSEYARGERKSFSLIFQVQQLSVLSISIKIQIDP